MHELLLELYSEEIPAGMQQQAAESMLNSLLGYLDQEAITYKSPQFYTTPQRIVLVVNSIVKPKAKGTTEKRGPRVGAPEAAIEGFAKSAGVAREALVTKQTDKGEFYFAVSSENDRAIEEILAESIVTTIGKYSWPKSMKWGSHSIRWVRPLHNILCVFTGQVLPLKFGHLKSNNKTKGHRFLSPKEFTVANFEEYKEKLAKNHVVIDQNERSKIILADAKKAAKSYGEELVEDERLLVEVTGLVEWPVVLIGKISEQFMKLPKEVLMTTMAVNQRYFSLVDKQQKLAPYFLTVANVPGHDGGKAIISGNERVLKARLNDAKFFYDQDLKHNLADNKEKLSKIIFHAKLGTVAEKTDRIIELAKFISVWVPHANLLQVERAALLAKCDLVTLMVSEFAELQGIMGYYYAKQNGEADEIAIAIKEHYKPMGPNDICPTNPVSIAVAIADKIDTLVGLFLVDERPTGSRDPYALRRAAIGVIRIILENKLHVPLKLLIEKSILRYPKKLVKTIKTEEGKEKSKVRIKRVTSDLLDFLTDRLRYALKADDVRHDLIRAVFESSHDDDILGISNKAKALKGFLDGEDGYNLLVAYKRATNIVVAEEKKDAIKYQNDPRKDLLTSPEEVELFNLFEELIPVVKQSIKTNNYENALIELAKFRKPIDRFFDKVQVNCNDNDIRKNRLHLLAQFRGVLNQVANFSIVEDKEVRK